MKKYIIILFSMLLLIGGLTNAQTIKRSKQKTEQRSKPKKEKQAKNSGTKKNELSKNNTNSKPNSSPQKVRQSNKERISYDYDDLDEHIDRLIRQLINNMVYIRCDGYLESDYYLCKYEVTQDLWYAIMGYNPSEFSLDDLQLPVENVSWDECQEFLAVLNDVVRYGINFRLPTENEWRFAAEGGLMTTNVVSLHRIAWFSDNSNHITHHVGTLKANELGLYDMSGNVSEWCAPPDNRATGYLRTYLGGNWNDNAEVCKANNSRQINGKSKNSTIGLRLAASYIDPDE